ncbi:MAG: hypothetical protein AB8B58_04445 [Roseobacter sp.]
MSDKPIKDTASKKPMPTLTVDWEAYVPLLEGSDLSDEDKREFIETLWSIVVGFVDLGFAVESPPCSCGQDADADASSSSHMVHSLVDHWDKAANIDIPKKNGSFEQSGPKQRGRTP